jgi:hypothetical protein
MTLTFQDPNNTTDTKNTTDTNGSTDTGTNAPAPHPPIDPNVPTSPTSKPSPSRPSLPITPVVAGLLATLGGAATVIGWAGWADLHPAPIIGGALAIVIGGFVARSQRGGGRGLIAVSVLMLTAVTVIAVASPYLDEGTGDNDIHPTSFSEVESDYTHGIGSMVVDLRDVEFPAGIHTIDIDHGIGSAQVWLPANVNYQVVGDTDIGDVDVFGETEDGFNNEVDAQSDVEADATVVIDFNVDIGYGRVGQN